MQEDFLGRLKKPPVEKIDGLAPAFVLIKATEEKHLVQQSLHLQKSTTIYELSTRI